MSKNTVRKAGNDVFSALPSVSIPRSRFHRPHGYKCTFDAGYLIPFYVDEVLPGDTFNVKASILARLATPITPFMDNVWIETHFFFVPNRILWSHFVNMMGERVNPDDSTDYICPVDTAPEGGWTVGSLYDYFGVPTGISGLEVNALYRRAYYRVWNEWFRDENLQDSLEDGLEVGDSGQIKDFALCKRNKVKDFYTSALPWPQKGPASSIGLAGNIPIASGDGGALIQPRQDLIALGTNISWFEPSGGQPDVMSDTLRAAQTGVGSTVWLQSRTHTTSGQYTNPGGVWSGPVLSGPSWTTDPTEITAGGNPLNLPLEEGAVNSSLDKSAIEAQSVKNIGFRANVSGLNADMSQVGLLDINSIREAFQIQKLLEKDARGGSRYVEQNIVHFGVRSPDARLQRPEYLGGSRSRLYVNAVAQSSSTDGVSPQGNLAAYGVGSDTFHGFTKSFVEHGVLLGLISVRADLSYQQGLFKKWTRSSRFDFYYPSFAHLGEQAILNKEIYAQGPSVVDDDGVAVDDRVFGYQERYAEYRYSPSVIAGKLRSTAATSLDIWHLAQEFENLPTLSSDFIEENPPFDRVIAVPSEPHFILDAFFDEYATRPMPVYSVPGLVDHF